MPLELSQLAGGLPIAVSLAMASGITVLREGRRRTSLNEAMHELRRPLQGLALSLPAERSQRGTADSCLEMAIAAVERLDREINGGFAPAPTTPVPLRSLVEAAVRRWRPRADAARRPLSLRWAVGEPVLQIDRLELGQALDNLINNAFDHGSGPVTVEVGAADGRICLRVCDGGDRGVRRRRRPRLRVRLAGRRRHGHGLRMVRRLAAQHGGDFALRRSPAGTAACLELPSQEADR